MSQDAPSCAKLAWYADVQPFCARATAEDFDWFIRKHAREFITDQHLRDLCFACAFKNANVQVVQMVVQCGRVLWNQKWESSWDISWNTYNALAHERADRQLARPSAPISLHVILDVAYHIFERIPISTLGDAFDHIVRSCPAVRGFNVDTCLLRAVHGGIEENVEFIITNEHFASKLTKEGIDFAHARAQDLFRPDLARMCMSAT